MSQLARLSAVLTAHAENDFGGDCYTTPEYIYRNPAVIGTDGVYVVQITAASIAGGVSHLVPTVTVGHVIQATTYESLTAERLATAEALAGWVTGLDRGRVTVADGDYAGDHNLDRLIVAVGPREIELYNAPTFDPLTPDAPLFRWATCSATITLQPT